MELTLQQLHLRRSGGIRVSPWGRAMIREARKCHHQAAMTLGTQTNHGTLPEVPLLAHLLVAHLSSPIHPVNLPWTWSHSPHCLLRHHSPPKKHLLRCWGLHQVHSLSYHLLHCPRLSIVLVAMVRAVSQQVQLLPPIPVIGLAPDLVPEKAKHQRRILLKQQGHQS